MNKVDYVSFLRGRLDNSLRGYFDGHYPRFDFQIDLFLALAQEEKIKSVLDIGTPLPFASGISSYHGCKVKYGCIDTKDLASYLVAPFNENCESIQINLNYYPEGIEPVDLVVCTEMLEHLPCNVVKARDWLADHAKKYLFLSFPLKGQNAGNYEADFTNLDHNVCHGHIREFTRQTAEEFMKPLDFEIVSEQEIFTTAYGGVIWNVLLARKTA